MRSPSTRHNAPNPVIDRLQELHPIHRELLQRYVARAEMSGAGGGTFNEVDWDVAIDLIKSSVRILVRRIDLPAETFPEWTPEERCWFIQWTQWNVTPLPKDVIDGLYRDGAHQRAVCRQFCDNEAYDLALAIHNDAVRQETEREAEH